MNIFRQQNIRRTVLPSVDEVILLGSFFRSLATTESMNSVVERIHPHGGRVKDEIKLIVSKTVLLKFVIAPKYTGVGKHTYAVVVRVTNGANNRTCLVLFMRRTGFSWKMSVPSKN
jgi:hypothetical protein|uniref:Uncharacterized protein n=1 Tax=Sipha flava TaxID=143950 RepID=A0A2S2PZX3_9HEMI